MDAWQRWLDGEAEEWRLLLREEFGEDAEMKNVVAQALQIHWEETEHQVQFKEEWVYDLAERCPHLPKESTYKVILRGATRFEQAHAIIENPDGARWIQALGPVPPTLDNIAHKEWIFAVGKPKKIKEQGNV